MSPYKLLILLPIMMGADINYQWDADGMDTGGTVIPPEVLSYNLYVATDGGSPALLTTTATNEFLWQQVPYGCHVAHVTAYRADADMESDSSNTVERCVDEETDGEVRALIPRTPGNFRGFFRWLR